MFCPNKEVFLVIPLLQVVSRKSVASVERITRNFLIFINIIDVALWKMEFSAVKYDLLCYISYCNSIYPRWGAANAEIRFIPIVYCQNMKRITYAACAI